jgi:ribosome biogenesis GTPase
MYLVRTPGGHFVCSLAGKMKQRLYEEADDGTLHRRYADPLAVGDHVDIRVVAAHEGVVEELRPRRTRLSRVMAKPKPTAPDVEQIVAANVDQVVVVASVKQPPVNLRFVDRLLLCAEAGGAQPFLCLNKSDLLDVGERDGLVRTLHRIYRPIGVPWLIVSAKTGDGLDALRARLTGCFSVLVGRSGAGKSSLLNALQPGLGLRTQPISGWSGKGRHTTTHVELHELDFGGHVADTPGLREAGIWGVPQDNLDYFFVEMRPFLGRCRFSNCRHLSEPGCAVREAVEKGSISPERYESYRRLRDEA